MIDQRQTFISLAFFPSYFAFALNCINLTKLSSPKFVQSGKDNFS